MKNVKKIIKISFLLIFTLSMVAFCVGCEKEPSPTHDDLVLTSFNIRLETASDSGVNNWTTRRPLVKEFILASNWDVICMQEVKKSQFEDLSEDLSETYEIIWKARDFWPNPEGLAILYKKGKYEVVDSGVFWLSETPDTMSISWCTTFRICVYANLKTITDDGNGATFGVYNVHLDHKEVKAQNLGMKVVEDRAKLNDVPKIICGDFNCNESSEAFVSACETYNNSRFIAPETAEKINTYTGFSTSEPIKTTEGPIDHILLSKDITISKFLINTDRPNNGGFYSDHYPITSHISVPRATVETK